MPGTSGIKVAEVKTIYGARTIALDLKTHHIFSIATEQNEPRQPATLGDRIDGWRVCWVGGWDRGTVFFVVMVSRCLYVTQQK